MRGDVQPPVPPLPETLDVPLQLLSQEVVAADLRLVGWRRELRSGQSQVLHPQQVPRV